MRSHRRPLPVLIASVILFISLACSSASLINSKITPTTPALQAATQPVAKTSKCKIPDLSGMDQQTAMKNLSLIGLTPIKTLAYSNSVPIDTVITTDPQPGTTLPDCQVEITLVISMGPDQSETLPTAVQDTPVAPTLAPTQATSSALDQPMYNILYQETFETLKEGLNPAWNMKVTTGGAVSAKDGALVIKGTVLAQVGEANWQNYRLTFTDMTGSGYGFVAFFRVQNDTTNSLALSCQDQASSTGSGNALHCEAYRIISKVQTKIAAAYPVDTCLSNCTITIEAKDNNFSFTFNGVEQFKFSDDTFKTGSVGFYVQSPSQSWTLSSFDVSTPPAPASPGQTLFRDDFKTSTWETGSFNTDFAAYEQTIAGGKYTWHVKAKQNVALKQCMKAVTPPGIFTLSVDVKLVNGPSNTGYALVFRCQDYTNLYYFNAFESGPWGFYKLVNGKWGTLVREDTSPVIPGQTNHLEVIGDGTNFALSLNGKLLQQVTDPEFKLGGIGLGIELSNPGDEATVEFDNLVIRYP